MLDLVEEALNQVSLLVRGVGGRKIPARQTRLQMPVVLPLLPTIAPRRDHSSCTLLLNQLNKPVGIITFVSNYVTEMLAAD